MDIDAYALLDVAFTEAELGLSEGGIPIGAALFDADGALLGLGHNSASKTTIRRSTPRPLRSARPVADATTGRRSW